MLTHVCIGRTFVVSMHRCTDAVAVAIALALNTASALHTAANESSLYIPFQGLAESCMWRGLD